MLKLNRVFFILALLSLPYSHVAFAQMDSGANVDGDVDAEDVMEEDDGSPDPVEISVDAPVDDDAGVPRFDWSKHQNATEVPHPYAEKGLLRITRDKTYIYKVSESEQQKAVQVRVGSYLPTNLAVPGEDGASDALFEDNYDQTDSPAFQFDWEWQAWKSPIGKWGLTLGLGAYVAQGNGHFAGTNNINVGLGFTPKEIFTLVVIPVSVGAVYRLQIFRRQLFVPYGAGGGMVFTVGEFRDDNKSPKGAAVLGSFYAAGVAMNLSYFDALARIQLDREYGINSIYLTAEYRGLISLNKDLDFGSDFVNGGFLMEY